MVYKHFDKKCATHKGTRINSDAVCDNRQLAKQLHKPTVSKFKKDCIKYARIRVFTDPYFPVSEQNLRFCPYP